VTATIGLHASASTWVFNVVRELMIAAMGEDQVMAFYADQVSELPDEPTRAGRHLVIKSHHGSAPLDAWLAETQTQLVLSIRDPRDACISMSERFKVPISSTAPWLANDCKRLLRLASQPHPLLRFEDRFFENDRVPQRLADHLGLRLAAASIDAICARYHRAAVQSFSARLNDLPPERLMSFGPPHLMDRVTHIHRNHIGDARSGKWRELPDPLQHELTRRFSVFLERFGYSP
jgi:hypothetical protein